MDVREQIALSWHFVRPCVHLSEGGSSDECATCREVNGGIELWSGPRCQERHGANFQQQGYNGMCVPICECLCMFVSAPTTVYVPPGTLD